MAVYYGKGTKDTILANIVALINAIASPDVVFVDYQRQYDSGVGPEKTPGAFVNDVTENKQQILKDIVKNNFTVGIVGWVRGETDAMGNMENIWSKLDDFVQAILTTLRSDPGLSSQCYKTEITRVETDSGSRFPKGVFVIIVSIVYFSTY